MAVGDRVQNGWTIIHEEIRVHRPINQDAVWISRIRHMEHQDGRLRAQFYQNNTWHDYRAHDRIGAWIVFDGLRMMQILTGYRELAKSERDDLIRFINEANDLLAASPNDQH